MVISNFAEALRPGADGDPLKDARHRRAVQAVASELGLPMETVAQRYRVVLREMSMHAQVADYLPVRVTKRIRRSLQPPRQ